MTRLLDDVEKEDRTQEREVRGRACDSDDVALLPPLHFSLISSSRPGEAHLNPAHWRGEHLAFSHAGIKPFSRRSPKTILRCGVRRRLPLTFALTFPFLSRPLPSAPATCHLSAVPLRSDAPRFLCTLCQTHTCFTSLHFSMLSRAPTPTCTPTRAHANLRHHSRIPELRTETCLVCCKTASCFR